MISTEARNETMNEHRFFGRERLVGRLSELWGKSVSSFVTCRGRRRVGKSTLIERFAERSGARFLKIEGVKPSPTTTDEDERRFFAEQLALQTGAERACPVNWLDAFVRLSKEIRDDGRTVVLLDEVSWMGAFDPMFASTLKIAWDNYLKKHDRLVFVVCGSVSTWIRDNIIGNKAFYGRRSADIVVPELPLRECVKFWGERAGTLAEREILDVLSVTGGIPKYLEEVNPSLSASDNIRNLCFVPNAPLRVDFDEMFEDVVTRQPKLSGRILRALAGGSKSVTEIAAALRVEKGGDITDALEQLVESGMVARDGGMNPATGAVARERPYRLKDNYSRFYLKYVEPSGAAIDADAFAFTGLNQFRGWETDMGLQFENLVVNNFRELLVPLRLDRVMIHSAAPFRRTGSEKTGRKGCQIDLLVQTDEAYYVVEIKRQAHIGHEIITEVREKCRRLPHRPEVSIRTALVHSGELAPSVEASGYFDAIVPFGSLLGL